MSKLMTALVGGFECRLNTEYYVPNEISFTVQLIVMSVYVCALVMNLNA
jgi:hypothetical protein